MNVMWIPLDKITPFPGNRAVGGFDEEKLEQLAASIRDIGVQQPAVVRKTESGYELVAGERRWRASRIAGCDTLPCIVRELTDSQAMKIQLVENLQRDDVHPLDECHGFAGLLDAGEYDVQTLAKEIGRSPSYVYQRLKLRDLIEPAKQALLSGQISTGHAIIIARLPVQVQEQALSVLKHGMITSVSQLSIHVERSLMLELSGVAFSLTQDDLIPEAGPCVLCAKRTGREPDLFGDIEGDRCMDAECFNAKLDATVERARKSLQGTEYVEVSGDYGYHSGAIPRWEWEEVESGDPESKRALIVSGQERGRLIWVKLPASYGVYDETEDSTEEDAAELEKVQRDREIERIAHEKAFEMALEVVEINPSGVLVNDAVIRALAESAFEWAAYHIQNDILGRCGWERVEIQIANDPSRSIPESPRSTFSRGIARVSAETANVLFVQILIRMAFASPFGIGNENAIWRRICEALGVPVSMLEQKAAEGAL